MTLKEIETWLASRGIQVISLEKLTADPKHATAVIRTKASQLGTIKSALVFIGCAGKHWHAVESIDAGEWIIDFNIG